MAQQLIVEGKDAVVLSVLCSMRGLPPPQGYENPEKYKKEFIVEAGNYDKALIALREAIDNTALTNIGIILDANEVGPAARWDAVKNILSKIYPEEHLKHASLQENGIVITGENLPVVGLWVMPDNRNVGYLEHFIARLIPPENDLWPHAQAVVNDLENHNLRRFGPSKTQKAMLHTWLAWQPEPGKPFGTALSSQYFDAHATAADGFIAWFRQTFALD